jgi:hypothetical protein
MKKDIYSYNECHLNVKFNACLGSADSISGRRWPQSEPRNNNNCLLFSSVVEPKIFLSAQAPLSRKSELRIRLQPIPAPAPDSFIRYPENYPF